MPVRRLSRCLSVGSASPDCEAARHAHSPEVLTAHPLFAQIYGQLIGGQSRYRIATWLLSTLPHDDPFGTSSTTLEVLARRLRPYREAVPDGMVLSQGYLDRRYGSLDIGIDVLVELDALIRCQKQRLEILAEREHELQLPIDAQRQEVHELADLLTKRHAMALSLGVTPVVQVEQFNLNVAGPPAATATTLNDLLYAHPELIPDVMALLDRIDAVTETPGVFDGMAPPSRLP